VPKVETPSAASRPYHHGDLRRVLIEAALALVTEKQDWEFSLREVARRAGVSHNAPYNHFGDKLEMLVAVVAAGFEMLRERMLSAAAATATPEAALIATAQAYVDLGVENPALYRLMFGPALAAKAVNRPAAARAAGVRAKAVLDDIILRGAKSGAFAASPDNESELRLLSLSALSAVHGLTTFVIDDFAGAGIAVPNLVERFMKAQLRGLAVR
jgi:AcrR family transcriptional regulator